MADSIYDELAGLTKEEIEALAAMPAYVPPVAPVVRFRATTTGPVDCVDPGATEGPPELLRVIAGNDYEIPLDWFPINPGTGEPIIPPGLERLS